MSKRIYRIQAHKIVPGMLTREDPLIDVATFDAVTSDGDEVSVDVSGLVTVYNREDVVEVLLPGPSPREVLCHPSCLMHSFSVAGDVMHGWQAHIDICPVREHRLRLWPVDGMWCNTSIGQAWAIPYPGHATFVMYVTPEEIANGFANRSHRDVLLAAFCEPEPT